MRTKTSYREGRIAKWLLTITLIFSLFAFSAPTSLSSIQRQATATEVVQLRGNNVINAIGYHDVSLHPLTSIIKAVNYGYCNLLYSCLEKVQFDHVHNNFIGIRSSIQSPCITFIFHHSGQESAIV